MRENGNLPAIAAENPKPHLHIRRPMITAVEDFSLYCFWDECRCLLSNILDVERYDGGGNLFVGKVC